MAASNTGMNEIPCADFLLFQDTIKKLRLNDDNIVQTLNRAIPSASFANKIDASEQCKCLYVQLHQGHNHRLESIKRCVSQTAEVVGKLKEQKAADPDNMTIIKKLRGEQKKLQFLKSEVYVEEIVQDRSNKVFYEKCRDFYLPPSS